MRIKRFLAIVLAAALLLPMCAFTLPEDTKAETVSDIWKAITAYEDARFAEQHISCAEAQEKDYAALTDGVTGVIEDWDGFVPGSLARNGDFLIWDGTDGVGYG